MSVQHMIKKIPMKKHIVPA